jgi:hypothetical protein
MSLILTSFKSEVLPREIANNREFRNHCNISFETEDNQQKLVAGPSGCTVTSSEQSDKQSKVKTLEFPLQVTCVSLQIANKLGNLKKKKK